MGLPRSYKHVDLMHDRTYYRRSGGKRFPVQRESTSVREVIKRTVNRRRRQAWRQSRTEIR